MSSNALSRVERGIKHRGVRVVATLVVTGLACGYILWKVDLRQSAHIIGNASPWWLLLAAFLTVVTVLPMAWRWQILLRARGIDEHYWWLLRAYFVSYAVGQVLPTSVGGDASRIYETGRRNPGQLTPITGSVILERALGGVMTLLLAALGFFLAIGHHYPVGLYLWIEGVFVIGAIVAAFAFFSTTVRGWLRVFVPLARKLRIERPARAVYEGVHGYRVHRSTLLVACGATFFVQLGRIAAIWACGRGVGVELSFRPYVILGPMLFLVMLVPVTLNGFGVREAFFIKFLGRFGVSEDAAFATGFLFFLLTLLLALPGLLIILYDGVRRSRLAAAEGAASQP